MRDTLLAASGVILLRRGPLGSKARTDCWLLLQVQLGDHRVDRGLHRGLVLPHLRRRRRRLSEAGPGARCGGVQMQNRPRLRHGQLSQVAIAVRLHVRALQDGVHGVDGVEAPAGGARVCVLRLLRPPVRAAVSPARCSGSGDTRRPVSRAAHLVVALFSNQSCSPPSSEHLSARAAPYKP